MRNRNYEPQKRKPIREIETKKTHSGESSPYWDFMRSSTDKLPHAPGDFTERTNEDILANPDILPSEKGLYNRALTEVGELQMQAVQEVLPELPLRERMAFDIVAMDRRTLKAAAEEMDVTIATVQSLLNRVRAKMKRRFDALMAAEN